MNAVREMAISAVDDLLGSHFDRCAPWLAAALKYSGGSHTLADVKRKVLAGELTLWPAADAVMVTEIEHYPQRKNYHVFLAGGAMEGLMRLTPLIEQAAVKAGCSAVTLTGRRGWERSFLRERGYEAKWIVMAKELGNGKG